MNWNPNLAATVQSVLDHDGYTVLMEMLDEREIEIYRKLASPNTDWEATVRLRGELEGIDRCRPKHVEAEINRALEASNGRRRSA
ncbi:MAG TPA: hypothetical protein VFP21_01230 [Solirubrobacterales bacterium]|nr:hypothetical protein [Solirubrobacterales bacterium]